jgi:TolB protein
LLLTTDRLGVIVKPPRTRTSTALIALILAWTLLGIYAQTARIGDFDAHGDIGAPKLTGSAAYNPVSQDYVLTAGGVNMWAQRDEFHFVLEQASRRTVKPD